ncbi:MAG: hypothetical protein FJX46_17375 [Alphaproteobacteria bacterium]|nr:hypothetical protein [Alphaproteobacteria bacterium]
MGEAIVVAIAVGTIIAIPLLGYVSKNGSDVKLDLRREISTGMKTVAEAANRLQEYFNGVESQIKETRKEIVALKLEIEELKNQVSRIRTPEPPPALRIALPQ